jgi:hypothetical protein
VSAPGNGHANGATNGHGARRRKPQGIALKKHLEALRLADLKDVHAFWAGQEAPDVAKRELVEGLERLLLDESLVYRRVKTLTRKVLDVLLLLLRREDHASDLPGLFRRLPGEEAVRLEYHEADAGLKALMRRGFLAELAEGGAAAGRVRYAVPLELGETLTALFREETRTVATVVRLADHLRSIPASERAALRRAFPGLDAESHPDDAARILAAGGASALLQRLPPETRAVVERLLAAHGGLATRGEWAAKPGSSEAPWSRKAWASDLEQAGLGTVARLSLAEYGIACDDEAVVLFREVLEDLLEARDAAAAPPEEVLRSGPDLMSDLAWFLEHVKRVPVRTARDGEVYKAGLKRIQDGFVSRETVLAGPSEVWAEVQAAAEHLALTRTDAEGFLEVRPEAERFVRLPLEKKVREVYATALEQPGPGGRSLHQHELRKVAASLLVEQPQRWWSRGALSEVARHRYLGSLDERGVKERFRDRFFSAWFSGRETLADLARELERHWFPRLHLLGILDAGVTGERVTAWRLSPLGARVLGAEAAGEATGLKPVRVNPDFEVVVLPDGDVSDVVHRIDGYAPRTKTGEVVHFRLTREGLETAVMGGRTVEEFLRFLEDRSLGGVPQNVAYTLRGWAQSVSFAVLERGVVLKAHDEAALERIRAVPGLAALVTRRLSPQEVLLKEEPQDRRLLSELREQGIHLQGP